MPGLEDLSREELIAPVSAQMDRITELADKVGTLEHLSRSSRSPPVLPADTAIRSLGGARHPVAFRRRTLDVGRAHADRHPPTAQHPRRRRS